MKTYLTLWFNSDGESPSEVTRKLGKLGFEPMQGNYDLAYDWKGKASMEEILKLGNLVQKALKGSRVLFKMETA
jgi:hypothetical protein